MRITSTKDLGGGLIQTTENRDRRVVLDIADDGKVSATIERVTITRINGVQIGGAVPAGAIPISDAQAREVAGFPQAYGTIVGAGDAAEEAREKAIAAAQAAEQQDAQP